MPLSVLEFASPVSFQVTNDGEEVGGALTYSVRTYVNNMQNSATVGELAKAVWNYYTSAAAYTEAASQPPADCARSMHTSYFPSRRKEGARLTPR